MIVLSCKKLRFLSTYRQKHLFQSLRFFSNFQDEPESHVNPFERITRPYQEPESRIAERICLTVLGNGAIGHPRCVGLFTNLKSYFFNCGEGVGRLCNEYTIDICSIKQVFITQKKWENISGLHDIFLTNQVFGVSGLHVHGPPGVEHFHTLLSSRALDTVLYKKPPSAGSYVDHTLEIEYVPIQCENKSFSHKRGKHYDLKGNSDVFSYICNIFEKPGDLLVDKCVEYGVPVGPDLLKLKNGENIVLPSGKIVYSKDVIKPAFPHTLILVVDCPSESFLEPFVSEKKFAKCFTPLNSPLDIPVVFHFTPAHVFSSVKYQDWIQRFPKNTLHFALNSENPTTSSAIVHQMQRVFHLMHPKVFAILQEKDISSKHSSCDSNISHPPSMLQYYIRPEKKLSWANVVKANSKVSVDDVYDIPGLQQFFEKLKDLKSNIIKKTISNDENKIYPEVIFLGTGSSTPTAYRNVSGILVNTSPNDTILLDCGEGTMMQLTRYYGTEDVYSVLRKMSCIFVSHKHTDHYMGLFQIITQRIKAFEMMNIPYKPVALILPRDTEYRLRGYCEIFQNIYFATKIFNCSYLKEEKSEALKPILGNIELFTVPVKHCPDAYGVVLQLGSEWKIVYSGDTAPCQKLIDAGKDCTLLIHEATMEDNLESEAFSKKHSTPSQVIDIAEKMNAKYTILTHFSKRYFASPIIQGHNDRHIGYAFDFMKVRMCDLPLLPLFIPLIRCLYKEQVTEQLEISSNVANSEKVFLKALKSQ